MAEKERPQGGPAGMAGLVRYYEQEKSVIKLKPEHVVYICLGIFALEILLMFVKI
jgi:preprotein translocase subunit Sec61beta